MQYLHFSYADKAYYGIVNNNDVSIIEGDIFAQHKITNQTLPLNKVTPLPATQPSKIIAVGLNFASHFSSKRGRVPRLFSKLPSSLTTTQQPVWLFPDSTNLHFEGELVVVIGKQASNISVKAAPDYIFGVTIGNDITDRSWQRSDLQWLRAKGADSFAPVAPYIVTGLNYNDLLVETRVNGKVMQSESTKNLLHNVEEIVSYASKYHTLYPGDLIFVGTPGKTQSLHAGDRVEVSIENIGKITNTITPRK